MLTEYALHAKRHRKELRRRSVRKVKRLARFRRAEAVRRGDPEATAQALARKREKAKEAQQRVARIAALAEKRTASTPSFLRRIWNRVTGRGA